MTHWPTVLLTRTYPPDLVAALAAQARVVVPANAADSLGYDAVLAQGAALAAVINQGELRIDATLLDATPRLRIVANTAIGVNNLALDLMRARGVWGTNTPDAFVDATADCALGLIITLLRRIGEGERFVRAGRWNSFAPGTWDGALLRGKTLGLVGYGRIGQGVARRAEPFGLRVIHHTRSGRDAPGWRPLDTLLGEADIVSLHVPLNADSQGLIGAAQFARMKPGAWLVNLARGPVVDEPALIAALQSGHLGGAALDVFADEPRVPVVLRSMENVVLTPHIGGGSREGRRSAQELCVENVLRALRGERPRPECTVAEPSAPATTNVSYSAARSTP